jgi:hypothetical protein
MFQVRDSGAKGEMTRWIDAIDLATALQGIVVIRSTKATSEK